MAHHSERRGAAARRAEPETRLSASLVSAPPCRRPCWGATDTLRSNMPPNPLPLDTDGGGACHARPDTCRTRPHVPAPSPRELRLAANDDSWRRTAVPRRSSGGSGTYSLDEQPHPHPSPPHELPHLAPPHVCPWCVDIRPHVWSWPAHPARHNSKSIADISGARNSRS